MLRFLPVTHATVRIKISLLQTKPKVVFYNFFSTCLIYKYLFLSNTDDSDTNRQVKCSLDFSHFSDKHIEQSIFFHFSLSAAFRRMSFYDTFKSSVVLGSSVVSTTSVVMVSVVVITFSFVVTASLLVSTVVLVQSRCGTCINTTSIPARKTFVTD